MFRGLLVTATYFGEVEEGEDKGGNDAGGRTYDDSQI